MKKLVLAVVVICLMSTVGFCKEKKKVVKEVTPKAPIELKDGNLILNDTFYFTAVENGNTIVIGVVYPNKQFAGDPSKCIEALLKNKLLLEEKMMNIIATYKQALIIQKQITDQNINYLNQVSEKNINDFNTIVNNIGK